MLNSSVFRSWERAGDPGRMGGAPLEILEKTNFSDHRFEVGVALL
jgi:hypothetical protein